MPIPWAVKCLKGCYCLKKNQSLKTRFADWFIGLKAEKDLQQILPFLKKEGKKNLKIIDIGTGSGGLACRLFRQGFKNLVCLDVKDLSLYQDLKVKIYSGKKLPFSDQKFDLALLIQVLHHCREPEKVLKEALRVAQRVIIIEDSYRNSLEKIVVSFSDCLGNFEFFKHPYKKIEQWQRIFSQLKAKVLFKKSWSRLSFGFLYGHYLLFVLESK